MKCFGLWINDDGTAQVAELSPEQGADLVAQVDAQPAASAKEAIQMLEGMATPGTEEPGEQAAEQSALKGYNKAPRPPKMSPGRVFGEDM